MSASKTSAEVVEFPKTVSMVSRPEAMVALPDDNVKLVRQAMQIIEICRADAGTRAAYYRQLNMIIETGKSDGTRSNINVLYSLVDRLAAHLFSPVNVQFTMDFENEYGPEILKRGMVASRLLGRSWEKTNTDVLFAQGVAESLKYGCCILKQWPTQHGADKITSFKSSLVMPWQFGVYRPDSASLDDQPAMCETVMMTLPEVWRRISHMPDARALFDRIKTHAAPGNSSDVSNSFFHQVLSTSPIQTGVGAGQRPVPGGIVQLSTEPNFSGIGPSAEAPMVQMHELWLWDQDDYVTIQIIEPDILIAPRYKRSNLLIAGGDSCLHPYTMIQANQTHGNIWGRSEIADLIEPQNWLSTASADTKRLFGVQVDKILAFSGDGLTDEQYDQMRGAGYMNLGQGGTVQDLTPAFPPEALTIIDKLIELIEMISGFDNMMSGRGESGVRSGAQANPLMKAAGARLKDRSLIIERQCAAAADLRLSLMEAKDGRNYWTDPKKPVETAFLLADLPDDRRVVIDGHSTSPVFQSDQENLVINSLKLGLIDKISAIEQLPLQNKDMIMARMQEEAEKQQALLQSLKQSDPEAYAKLLAGGKKH